MKKRIALACIVAAGFSLLLLTGCKKLLDYIHPRPDDKGKNCRIEKVTTNYANECDGGNNFSDTAWFSYNQQGNPASVKYTFSKFYQCWSYPLDKYFKYDNSNKLLLFLDYAFASGKAALFWHKYNYVNSYLITDSMFVYAEGDWFIHDRPQNFAYVNVTAFELDYFGRVISETEGVQTKTYTYDSNGNLVKPGVTYSNKMNIRQTNKVWMFLDRDYSLNSPEGDASQYNGEKLPVKLNEMPHFINREAFDFHDIAVKYKCK